jgi:hypothetical protein
VERTLTEGTSLTSWRTYRPEALVFLDDITRKLPTVLAFRRDFMAAGAAGRARLLFDAIDTNGDGSLQREEVAHALRFNMYVQCAGECGYPGLLSEGVWENSLAAMGGDEDETNEEKGASTEGENGGGAQGGSGGGGGEGEKGEGKVAAAEDTNEDEAEMEFEQFERFLSGLEVEVVRPPSAADPGTGEGGLQGGLQGGGGECHTDSSVRVGNDDDGGGGGGGSELQRPASPMSAEGVAVKEEAKAAEDQFQAMRDAPLLPFLTDNNLERTVAHYEKGKEGTTVGELVDLFMKDEDEVFFQVLYAWGSVILTGACV